MVSGIIKSIVDKSGNMDLLDVLTKKLSYTELNSLLLEVYRLRCDEINPSDLMKSYEKNIYVKPASEDPVRLRKLEIEILETAKTFSFKPVELSPVVPLGACSAVAQVNQNNILSSLRGTEVLSDATNSLALYICSLKRDNNRKMTSEGNNLLKYCTVIRHIRTQKINNPLFTPHFLIYCMVTSGMDNGSYNFEKQSITDHLNFYIAVLKNLAHAESFRLKLFKVGGSDSSDNIFSVLSDHIRRNFNRDITIVEDMTRADNHYYGGIQFKIYININGFEAEAADGGFVDWPQKLLGNKKERMMISAIGMAPLLIMNQEP